jgi:hypothetical protein
MIVRRQLATAIALLSVGSMVLAGAAAVRVMIASHAPHWGKDFGYFEPLACKLDAGLPPWRSDCD